MSPNGGAADSGAGSAAANASHDAVVVCVGGKVEVVADGSSLNQILQEIGRVSSIKITGTVADEPVYGRYGPGPASEVLSTLLDGTGSNMLLREATAAGPGELILTARSGGVTPPDPNARSNQEGYVEPNVPGSKTYQRPREAWMNTTAQDIANGKTVAGQQQSGNDPGQGGVAERPSPQQVYQQLQHMQQTQQAVPQTQQTPER